MITGRQIDEAIVAIRGVTGALHALGTGDATTTMGAIELLAKETKEGSGFISDSISDLTRGSEAVAEAISEGSEAIADAINNLANAVSGISIG